MSNAPVTGRHRAVNDGSGHCVVCRVTVIDWGRGIQHQQGWAGRQERERLGLPVRTHVAKPGTRAERVAALEDQLAILTRDSDRLRRAANAVKRFDQLDAHLDVIEERLEAIEALLEPKRLRVAS